MSAILYYIPGSEKINISSQEYFDHLHSDLDYRFLNFKCECCNDEGHSVPLISHIELGEICPTCLKEHLEDSDLQWDIPVAAIFEARAFVNQYPIFAGQMAKQVTEILAFIGEKTRAVWRGNYRMIVKGNASNRLIRSIIEALLERELDPDTITQSAPEPDYDNEAQAYQENSIL